MFECIYIYIYIYDLRRGEKIADFFSSSSPLGVQQDYSTRATSRASYDDVDILDSGEWIHLKMGHRPGESGGARNQGWFQGRPALVWCLAGFDYEMPELDFDDLVLGFGHYPWSPIVALHVSLNSGVDTALMCLDSLRLPSCTRNPHTGSGNSNVKIIKESVFL
ncbi:hypothetical protein M9H77_21733 [Catharanthus roseus]|uniref:Uncharacterized protein n=1 Tax=Catharanthus roseus TaxID=4058 RepID=A0ACC0ANE3_CATRO|nr:hypothetical protein M9H77_21733 [Catharanthus roseus]